MAEIKVDKLDIIIACSSGAISGAVDNILCTDFGWDKAHDLGEDDVTFFIRKITKNDNLKSAVSKLERKYKNKSDNYKNFQNSDKYGGSTLHHLREFSHHPTPFGLLCSIVTEFTGEAYGTNDSGLFMPEKIDGFKKEKFPDILFKGAFKWGMHLLSDVAGSSGSIANESDGTGIPGPLLATLKEISSIPGFNNPDKINKLSEKCDDLFNGKAFGTEFDYRTELGIAHIITNQMISVLLCEAIVCAFYSIRCLFEEISSKKIGSLSEINELDFRKILPWKSDRLSRMRTISALSFSAVDMSSAAVMAFSECSGDKTKFALEFAKRVNYISVGRLIVSGVGEVNIKLDKSYDNYMPVVQRYSKEVAVVKNKSQNILHVSDETKAFVEKGLSTATSIATIGTPIGFISAAIGVYKEISESAKEYKIAKEERIRIEAECKDAIEILNEYQEEMETVVSEYMIDRLTIFGAALDQMDLAIVDDDTDAFIEANNKIQNKLGKDSQFTSMDEFDALMSSDGIFKF